MTTMRVGSGILALVLCIAVLFASGEGVTNIVESEHTFLDFTVEDLDGKQVPMTNFQQNPVILVVNVASECGYTDQNYRELQTLYEKYYDRGFTVLGFPCNQFGRQEPGSSQEIKQFVESTYHITFPIFAKVDVNGEHAHPLFKFLTQKLTGFVTNDIKWNFSKFLLVNHEPFKRYGTSTAPFEIEADIAAALEAAKPSTRVDEL